jgi:hypothetical protein
MGDDEAAQRLIEAVVAFRRRPRAFPFRLACWLLTGHRPVAWGTCWCRAVTGFRRGESW